ncbi:unnamed protein product [Brassica oleracea var. botrytis]
MKFHTRLVVELPIWRERLHRISPLLSLICYFTGVCMPTTCSTKIHLKCWMSRVWRSFHEKRDLWMFLDLI